MLNVQAGLRQTPGSYVQELSRQVEQLFEQVELGRLDLNSIREGILHISVPLREGLYSLPGKYKNAQVRVSAHSKAWLTVCVTQNSERQTVIQKASIEISPAVRISNPSSAYEKPSMWNSLKDVFAGVKLSGIEIGPAGEILFQGKIKKGFLSADVKTEFKPELFPKIDLRLENLFKQELHPDHLTVSTLLTRLGAMMEEATLAISGSGLDLHMKSRLNPKGQFKIQEDAKQKSTVKLLGSEAQITGTCELLGLDKVDLKKVEANYNLGLRLTPGKPIQVASVKAGFEQASFQIQGRNTVATSRLKLVHPISAPVSLEFELKSSDLQHGTLSYALECDTLGLFKGNLDYAWSKNGWITLHPNHTGVSEFLDPTEAFIWESGQLSSSTSLSLFTGENSRQAMESIAGAPIRSHNHVELLIDGVSSLPQRIKLIREAKHSIYLQTMIFKNDASGSTIVKELIEAKKRGVQVYVIIDKFGNMESLEDLFVKNELYDLLKTNGISLETYGEHFTEDLCRSALSMYNKQHKLEPAEILRLSLQINNRWHEKYLIADGQKVIMGGMNISDEYLKGGLSAEVRVGQNTRLAWRDTDILIEGDGALDALAYFSRNWESITHRILPEPPIAPRLDNLEKKTEVQIIQSRPRAGLAHPITNFKMEALKALQAGDKAYEASAYFLPLGALKPFSEALELAAQRGVDVRIVTNSMESTDMPQINRAALVTCYRDLLKSGVRIFEKTGSRTTHQKTAVYGSKVAQVGSFNLDNRSGSLNSETLAVVHNEAFAKQVEQMILDDMNSETAKEIKLNDIESMPAPEELQNAAWAMLGDLM